MNQSNLKKLMMHHVKQGAMWFSTCLFATFLKITLFSSQCNQTNLKTHNVPHFVLEKIQSWGRNHHFFKRINCVPVRTWEVPFWPHFPLFFGNLPSLAAARPDLLQMKQCAWFLMPNNLICMGGHQNLGKIKLGGLWEQKGWIFRCLFATFLMITVFLSHGTPKALEILKFPQHSLQ